MWLEAFNYHNYQWNPWAIPPLIGSAYFLFIGLLVYLKNKKSKLNISFGFMCLSSFIWQFSFTMMLLSKDSFYPIFWNKLLGSGVVFIDLGWYLYVINLCKIKEKVYLRMAYLFLLKSIAFGYLVISSNLILTDLRKHAFGYYLVAGKLHPLFLFLFISVILLGLVLLLKTYVHVKGKVERLKIKYVVIGVAIYSLACVDYIPMYTKVSLYPFGDTFIIIFISILFYGIVRYRAMEIDTVIHRTALWAVSVLLLIMPLCLIIALVMGRLVSISLFLRIVVLALTFLIFLDYYHRLKPRIDHLFRRRKYDYYHLLGEIIQKIGSELDINNVISRLLELKNILYIRNEIILIQQPEQKDYYIEVGRKGYERLVEYEKKEAARLEPASPLSLWLNQYRRAMEKEQVEADPQYESIRDEAISFFNENAIEVLIPVIMEDKVNALVGIGKKENLQAYTIKDIELLESMGRQIGVTIDNALHHQDIVDKERMAEEMKLGREIQVALLPQAAPRIAGLNVQGLMNPAREIGGDYYDFITLPGKDQLAIVIGDVSGKGVAAGLLMAMAKTAIHTLSQEQTSPKQILLRTNTILNQHISGQKFMTLLYLMWQADTKTLTYCSGGHEHILIYRNESGQIETIQSGGFMLGMIADIDNFLEEKQIKLKAHDKILLYTDGVTEAQNQKEERFGLARLKEMFQKHSQKQALELMGAVKDEVYSFIGTYPQYDDISLVVLEAQ